MNGTVLGFRPKEKGGKEGHLIRFLISSIWIRDPLRRNLLRKGRLQISSKKVEFAYFLILLKFRKALSRCMSAHEAVSMTGKDDYPWVNYSHCDVSL